MVHLPGGAHTIFLAVMALIFFGPRKLPELMHSIGDGSAQMKTDLNDFVFVAVTACFLSAIVWITLAN